MVGETDENKKSCKVKITHRLFQLYRERRTQDWDTVFNVESDFLLQPVERAYSGEGESVSKVGMRRAKRISTLRFW